MPGDIPNLKVPMGNPMAQFLNNRCAFIVIRQKRDIEQIYILEVMKNKL